MATEIITITDPADPRLQPFGEARDAFLRQRGAMLVEAARVVKRLESNGIAIEELLVTPDRLAWLAETLATVKRCYVVSSELMQTIVGYRLHQGVIALAARPTDSALAALGERIVALNGIQDAENVGAIVRAAHAFGFDSILVDQRSCTPWIKRAIRCSMGSVFTMKIRHTVALGTDLKELADRGYTSFAAGGWGNAESVSDVTFPRRLVLVLGNEGDGVEPAVRQAAARAVRIPMAPGIDSLNVAAAAAILFYAASATIPAASGDGNSLGSWG